jgi:integrase
MTGADVRASERAKRASRILTKARAVFAGLVAQVRQIPQPVTSDLQTYEDQMAKIRTVILASSHAPSFKYLLQRLLQTYSRHYLAQHGLDAQPFFAPVQLARPKSRRSERGFNDLPLMRKCEALFGQYAALGTKEKATPVNVWLALVCWSAATRGFLAEPELIEALVSALFNAEQPLHLTIEQDYVVRLFVARPAVSYGRGPRAGPNSNWRQAAARGRVHYWYPDPLTLALIMNLRSARDFELGATPRPEQIFERAGGILPFASLAELVRSAVWFFDDWQGLGLPEAVITAISGSWSVTGLDDTAFALLHQDDRASAPALDAGRTVVQKPAASDTSRAPQFEKLRRAVGAAKPGATTAMVAELNAIIAHSVVVDTTRLLAEWLREVLYVGGVKVATAKTYLSRIGPRLFAEFGETELVGIGEEDFLEAYRSCIAATRSRENAILVSQLLAQFHAFAVRRFGLPELDEGISQLSGVRMVRARHLRVQHLGAVQNWLETRLPTPWSRAAIFATLLASRCGLRLGEVCGLRPVDFENSDQRWLFVRANAERGLKTEAARRKIPLRRILTDDESARLDDILAKVQAHPRASIVASLVGWSIDPKEISRLVSQALRETVGGEAWTFHHLRHVAANNLLLVALGETELCEQYTGWDMLKQHQVLLAFVPHASARQLRFTGMSAFLGHARVQQTFESYLHILPEIVAHRRKRLMLGDDRTVLLALLQRGRGDLLKSATVADGQRLFGPRLKSLVVPQHRPIAGSPPARPPAVPVRNFENLVRLVVGQLWSALSHVERGWPCEAAAEESGLDAVRFEEIVARCRKLAELRTKRGQRRLIAQDRANAPANPLVPPLPPAKSEVHSARFYLEKLVAASMNPLHADDVRWLTDYVTNHSDVNNTGVPFRDPADLQRMRVMLNRAGIADKLLHVEFRISSKKLADEWKDAVAGLNYTPLPDDHKRAHAEWAKGHVRLIVERADNQAKAKLRTNMRRSSSGWRFAIYMLAALEPWAATTDHLWQLFRSGRLNGTSD